MEEKLESAEDLLGGNLAGGATSPLEIWDMQERDRIRGVYGCVDGVTGGG